MTASQGDKPAITQLSTRRLVPVPAFFDLTTTEPPLELNVDVCNARVSLMGARVSLAYDTEATLFASVRPFKTRLTPVIWS